MENLPAAHGSTGFVVNAPKPILGTVDGLDD
jgi:hypothetical protein